jgi:hypothetical protein
MTSVKAFNDMMEQFLTELRETFPENGAIKKYQVGFDILKSSNPKKCVKEFMKGIEPYAQQIMAKEESFFLNDPPAVIADLNLAAMWTPELSQGTKDAIWQYFQTLYMLGTTITSIPADTLNMIEKVAKQCADSMQGGGGGLDEKALMSSMSGLFGGLLKNKN